MTQPQTGQFISKNGFTIHTASWRTVEPPKGAIFLVHGYGEHHGRYAHVIEAFAKAGYAVYAIDHRGHGRSEGDRAYVVSIDELVADLRQYFEACKKELAGQKVFMYGHSMGSLVSLLFAIRYQDDLNGLILSGLPLNANESVSPMLITTANLLDKIVPKMPLAETTPANELAADQSVAAAFAADPLNWKGKMRVRTGVSIANGVNSARAQIGALRLPVLFLHGADDKICPPGGSQFALDNVSSPDKQRIVYPGLRHEIHNEKIWTTVMQDMFAWLNGH